MQARETRDVEIIVCAQSDGSCRGGLPAHLLRFEIAVFFRDDDEFVVAQVSRGDCDAFLRSRRTDLHDVALRSATRVEDDRNCKML
jgi:hypothetical protein